MECQRPTIAVLVENGGVVNGVKGGSVKGAIDMAAGPATPLYSAVMESLLARIAQGLYQPGSTMPSEAQLCEEFGVSRITIRRALDGLAERRLIRRSKGAGTVICEPEELGKSVFLTGYIDDVIPLNQHRVVADRRGIPPDPVRMALGSAPDSPVRCITSVNHADGLPLSFTHFWFPEDSERAISADDFRGAVPPIRVIEQRLGRSVVRAEQTVDPVTADREISKMLSVPVGTPLLQALRTYYDAEGRPLESIVVRYHPGRYRFRVTLLPKIVPVRASPMRAGSRGSQVGSAKIRGRGRCE